MIRKRFQVAIVWEGLAQGGLAKNGDRVTVGAPLGIIAKISSGKGNSDPPRTCLSGVVSKLLALNLKGAPVSPTTQW